jgi:hypothetical protein
VPLISLLQVSRDLSDFDFFFLCSCRWIWIPADLRFECPVFSPGRSTVQILFDLFLVFRSIRCQVGADFGCLSAPDLLGA